VLKAAVALGLGDPPSPEPSVTHGKIRARGSLLGSVSAASPPGTLMRRAPAAEPGHPPTARRGDPRGAVVTRVWTCRDGAGQRQVRSGAPVATPAPEGLLPSRPRDHRPG
jgi:hypothetical protein